MSQYYNPNRTRNLYDKNSKELFRLSRGRIDNFIACPRCFYLDRKLGVFQPPGFPFSLNSAVDKLLKKEFDIHRKAKSKHPLMETYNIDAIPFDHEKLEEWQDSMRRGITFQIDGTNIVITGGMDDLWKNPQGELHMLTTRPHQRKMKFPWMRIGRLAINAKWKYISGYLEKTVLKFRIPAILFTAMATPTRKHLMAN